MENGKEPHIKSGSLFYIENLGCAKNQVDAESIIAAMKRAGWTYVEQPDDAEILIVNTCGFIEAAKEESIDVTLDLRKRFPQKKIVLSGCFSQRYGENLKGFFPEVDGIFGNKAPARLPEMIDDVLKGSSPVFIPEHFNTQAQGEPVLSYSGTAYVKIAEGCDNHCAYCSIPLIRGGLLSRTIEDIDIDVGAMIRKGTREINLVAQDLGSFGMDRGGREIGPLLEKLLSRNDQFWIRMLYIHPDHFPSEIVELCKKDSRLLPYFDLPFQHASARILRAMGRKGDSGRYLALLDTIRSSLPEAAIRSTFLVGFPGEKQRDFTELLEFQAKAELDWAGVFTYSREEDTPAFNYDKFSFLPRTVKKRRATLRARQIEDAQLPITEKKVSRHIGKKLDVLIEERIKGENLYIGRLYAQAPEVDGLTVVHGKNHSAGTLINCRIIKQNGIDLEAVAEGS